MSIVNQTVASNSQTRSTLGDCLEILSKLLLACLFLRFAIDMG